MTSQDKRFLLDFQSLGADWSIYDFEAFPSIKWKIANLMQLKKNDPKKFDGHLNKLNKILESF